MTTFAIRPQQDGYWRGWSAVVGGTFAYRVVSDGSDATYIVLPRQSLPDGRASFPCFRATHGLLPISVQIAVRAQRDAGGSGQTMQVGFSRVDAVAFDGVVDTIHGSPADFAHTYAVNPFTGQPWAAADLPGLEICVSRSANVGNTRIIEVSGVLTYSQAHTWRGDRPRSAQLG